MPDLVPAFALGGTAPRQDTHGSLTLSENTGLALASLALRKGQAAPRPFGLHLPEPGRAMSSDGTGAFWTGRGQWMIEAEGRAGEDFAAAVLAEAPGCSVTEQTDGFAAIDIASAAGAAPLEALLIRLANLDIAAFGPGACTRTGLDHMSVFVLRRSETQLCFLGLRSLAGSLWHALSKAARTMQG